MTETHTIQSLFNAMLVDLEAAHSASERSMCEAINGKEIRELAMKESAHRRLGSRELQIAQRYGFVGRA